MTRLSQQRACLYTGRPSMGREVLVSLKTRTRGNYWAVIGKGHRGCPEALERKTEDYCTAWDYCQNTVSQLEICQQGNLKHYHHKKKRKRKKMVIM